jgi:hypothetical protein
MPGGADAQRGFVYQQDYVAFQILHSEVRRLIFRAESMQCVASFKVEGRRTENGPAWDVGWTLLDGSVHLRECKDTVITRLDRQAFYLRVRREIAEGTAPSDLFIGWVTDAGKPGQTCLDHLDGIARLASSDAANIQNRLPARVSSAKSALEEALYFLTDATLPHASMSRETAMELLSRLAIDRFLAEDLAARIECMAPEVFTNGTGCTIRELIHGKLSTTIQRAGSAEFTQKEFLEHLGLGQLELGLVESLREILRFACSFSSADIKGIKWSFLPDRPPKIWPLKDRLRRLDEQRSFVLIAPTGVGKTTSCLQACCDQADKRHNHHVLRVDAGDADSSQVTNIPRLCCMLSGVSATWLAIDGLDQIPMTLQQEWRSALRKLLSIKKLTLVVTARREVVASYDWMQELLSGLPEIRLEPLTADQVIVEFQNVGLTAPRNRGLIDCLRNAFLFSIYARTVSDGVMPLSEAGEVTAFDVVRVYWERRVGSVSQGLRAIIESRTDSAHAKRVAAAYLAGRTIAGEIVFERPTDVPDCSNGIEMLCREGVLVSHSNSTVMWSHGWLREYAVIDRLVGQYEHLSAGGIADIVGAIQVDHVARVAAVGGCKWVVSHPAIGSTEDYIAGLYALNKGLAREVLTVLLEDSQRHLRLAGLEVELLIEALSLARMMKVPQWLDQVARLPDALFEAQLGSELLRAVLLFESEMANNG